MDNATVENICKALYPKNNNSRKEAREYANYLKDIDRKLYNNRKEHLCRINHLVSGSDLDEIDNDPCRNTKIICSDASNDIAKDSILIDTYNVLYGETKALKEEGCIELEEEE